MAGVFTLCWLWRNWLPIKLKNDFTYKQRFVYKGKSDEQFVDEGNWIFVSDSVIELESYDFGKLFLISGKELIMLDEYGDRIESEFESKYHLKKIKAR